jgi:hypothetical protein
MWPYWNSFAPHPWFGHRLHRTRRSGPPRSNDIKQAQSAIREAFQQGCLHFAETQPAAVIRVRNNAAMDAEHWRRSNAATMMRLMFLPLP